MPPQPPHPNPSPAPQQREAAVQLASSLDIAGLHHAAAYASMAVDAITHPDGPPTTGLDMRTDVELEFELDEHDRVWMIREGDCHIIGRTNAVCAEMRRFLTAVVTGSPLPSIGAPSS